MSDSVGALLPAVELEQRQTSACPFTSGAGQGMGGLHPAMALITFGLGISSCTVVRSAGQGRESRRGHVFEHIWP